MNGSSKKSTTENNRHGLVGFAISNSSLHVEVVYQTQLRMPREKNTKTNVPKIQSNVPVDKLQLAAHIDWRALFSYVLRLRRGLSSTTIKHTKTTSVKGEARELTYIQITAESAKVK